MLRGLRKHTSGNAAFIVAIGMPAFIGGAGMAVDVSQWYLWKREVQHSADQAALAGAWALIDADSASSYEMRAKQEFDGNLAVTADFVSTPNVTLADYAGGEDNSVVITAQVSKRLPFSGFLTGNAVTVAVRAQASFKAGANYGACLIALKKNGNGMDIGGNASVKAACGLAALSCGDDAVVIDGSATVETDSIATCGKANVPPENQDVVSENVKGLQDIYADLVPPENNDVPPPYSCKNVNKTEMAILRPGIYNGGIVVKCNTTLDQGVYIIDGGILDLSANYDVTGANVLFVLKNGARIKLGGNGNGNKITLSPMESGPYKDILIIEDRDSHPDNPGHKINGNSNSLIEGLIYLPNGEIEILGTADIASQCLQISAYKIKISGNANIETLCPTGTSVGSGLVMVRLVG
ncbi:hypothetical protein NT2_09_01460 [Caenibius tardaugens NBRC 16725]|uniref:Putative Flp pilus-assembly TadG-like N-terminal domain-containing protein n=2 Tax=Caenibius TaxID=2827482 RepID=U3A719_9SPHN|nr:pilus assembly protein [Caenibius tardaugens NBRC 16725]GAD50538.1 hypothetical protein NT2_09_01460 [Caenibius tardaugens NBRC 16725]